MTDEQIIEVLGLGALDQTMQQTFVDNIRATVDIRVGAVVEEMLTEEQYAEFSRLQDAGGNEVIWEWLKNTVVGVDMRELYEATLATYLEEVKEQQAAL